MTCSFGVIPRRIQTQCVPPRESRNLTPAELRFQATLAVVHQLVLDRIFGTGVYRGVLVVSAETKGDSRTGEVIEICVPRQLQMFQSRVAELSRIYYLDPPQVYLALANDFPRVEVRSFGEGFSELHSLLPT